MTAISINHVEKRATAMGEPRAFIAGTRVRVQDIVADHERHGLTPEQIAREYPHISQAQIHAALAYYFDHRQEIQRQMLEDEQYIASVNRERKADEL